MFILFKDISRNNRKALLKRGWESGFHGSSLLAVLVRRPSATSAEFRWRRLAARAGAPLTRTHTPGEDPGPCGHGSLDQAFPEHLLQLGLHLKALEASMHRYQKLGELQLPIFHHEVEQGIWLGVIGNADVLQKKAPCSAPDLGFVCLVRGSRVTTHVQGRAP